MRKVFLLALIIITASLIRCREPFEPDFETGVNDYLVVEGFINVGTKAVTVVKLSRVSRLDDMTPPLETAAAAWIESDDGDIYPLNGSATGLYKSDSLSLSPSRQYRLVILEEKGTQYASSFTSPLPAPPIDSIYVKRAGMAYSVVIATHGGPEDTRFYQWDYTETWEIQSTHPSYFMYDGNIVKRRPSAETSDMRICWRYAYPEDLVFGSTEKLDENVMHKDLVTFSETSDRMHVKYSINVQQRGMTEQEYRYIQLIQKNSTSTGSLFDPMPSEIRGNLQCITNPDIPVVGFVGVTGTTTRRVFKFPADFDAPRPARCVKEIVTTPQIEQFFGEQGYNPVDSLGVDFRNEPIYGGAPIFCTDCRLRGTPVRPDFW